MGVDFDVTAVLIDLKDEIKESIQIEEQIKTQVEMVLDRVDQNESDLREIYSKLANHAARLSALEKSEETLEERAGLWIERALRAEGDSSSDPGGLIEP